MDSGDSLNKLFENRQNREQIEELRHRDDSGKPASPPEPAVAKEVEFDPFQGTYIMATPPDEKKIRRAGSRELQLAHFSSALADSVFARLSADEDRLVQLARGVREKISIVFADIRGFSYISGMLPADRAFKLLNIFHSEMIKIVRDEHGGCVHAITGDCLVACFGLPYPSDSSILAVKAALAMQSRMSALSKILEANGLPSVSMGVGVNTGLVHAGFVTTDRNVSAFSIIGEAVNIASKLENIAPRGEVMIGETVRDEIASSIAAAEFPEKVVITTHEGHTKTFTGFLVR